MTHPSRRFTDLMIQDAIVRPGPNGSAARQHLHRMPARQQLRNPDFQIPYLHPSFEEPLSGTLGTMVFQDQVIGNRPGGRGVQRGAGRGMRRAMSRKRSAEAMDAHRRAVRRRGAPHAPRRQPTRDRAGLEQSARLRPASGSPRPTARPSALLAYQSTWLTRYYPPEFLCALLNEQPIGFYPPDTLIHEAQHRGIETLPPDVVHSEAECTLTRR